MASRFWVGGTGNWDATNTDNWSALSGDVGGASVPVAADTVTFDASSGGGVITLQYSPTVTSITMGAFTGTFDANDFNLSMNSFSCTGTGVRTLDMGSGTWILKGTGTIWNTSTATNFTLIAGTSTINPTNTTATTKTLTGGGKVYYNLYYQGIIASLILTNMNFSNQLSIIAYPYNEVLSGQEYLNKKLGTVGLTKQQCVIRLAGIAEQDAPTSRAWNAYAGTLGTGRTAQEAANYLVGTVGLPIQECDRLL